MRAIVSGFTATMLVSVIPFVHAGSIYKCTQADGSITLSDSVCPPDALTSEYKGEATRSRGGAGADDNPYSIMKQVQMIEKREKAERKAAAKERKARDKSARAASGKQSAGPVLSYREARQKALAATGYRNYETLSETQRQRVQEEMTKYQHRAATAADTAAKATTNRKSTRATKAAPRKDDGGKDDGGKDDGGESGGTSGGPTGVADPRNGALLPSP